MCWPLSQQTPGSRSEGGGGASWVQLGRFIDDRVGRDSALAPAGRAGGRAGGVGEVYRYGVAPVMRAGRRDRGLVPTRLGEWVARTQGGLGACAGADDVTREAGANGGRPPLTGDQPADGRLSRNPSASREGEGERKRGGRGACVGLEPLLRLRLRPRGPPPTHPRQLPPPISMTKCSVAAARVSLGPVPSRSKRPGLPPAAGDICEPRGPRRPSNNP
ncbi:hypothetical protein AAFF_G00346330 [Aldrovandia affinis]|uniref:Uncharacterized protein n=1 Tax=Aldrovandia affinis TaxID=143900 RepID=A0AAD7SK06_9TELE|nr:hypothetical protein AAFF_G00346330 [Aldrovandia affinis]